MSERIPKYTADLLEKLDSTVGRVSMDHFTAGDWGNLSEGALRTMAFHAGMRAIVDELLAWQEEVESDADPEAPQSVSLDRPVLDASGATHIGVASPHMAPAPSEEG